MRALLRAAILAAAVAAPPGRAAAPERSVAVRIAPVKARAVVSLGLGSLFDGSRERVFGNGLTNIVVVYTSVVPARGGAPLSAHGRIIEILYDVWEETYAVEVTDPDHPTRRLVVPHFAALRAFLADQRNVDVGSFEALPDAFRLEVRVEVNPVSKEQLQKTREYIAATAAGTRASGSRSVLGAVASFLLREPDAGTDVHVFRSDVFTKSELVPR
ncbi:MAG TPA: hypothetical protein VEB43_19135 [Anaeromyxobacter sp.]|nr:hypothetical protein [Anaeromyxobacter sp.]